MESRSRRTYVPVVDERDPASRPTGRRTEDSVASGMGAGKPAFCAGEVPCRVVSAVTELGGSQTSFRPIVWRDLCRHPRGVGLALFAVGLFVYGVLASDGAATLTAVILAGLVVLILVLPAAAEAQRLRRSDPSE